MFSNRALLFLALMTIFSGCGRKAILVQPGTVMPLAKEAKVKLFVPDENGNLLMSDVFIPPGTLIKTQADK